MSGSKWVIVVHKGVVQVHYDKSGKLSSVAEMKIIRLVESYSKRLRKDVAINCE